MITFPAASAEVQQDPQVAIRIRDLNLFYDDFQALIDINASFKPRTITATTRITEKTMSSPPLRNWT